MVAKAVTSSTSRNAAARGAREMQDCEAPRGAVPGMLDIVVTTATFGTYEKTLKDPVHCNVPFVAYTDQLHHSSCWRVVSTPYHEIMDPTLWEHNSIASHASPFNIAKFYKMNLHRLPELRGYEFVLWLDGSVRLKADVPFLLPRFRDRVCWSSLYENLPFVRGLVSNEVTMSMNATKYTAAQIQRPQDVSSQYKLYLEQGFRERWWLSRNETLRQPGKESRFSGVWVTTFILWRMSNPWRSSFWTIGGFRTPARRLRTR